MEVAREITTRRIHLYIGGGACDCHATERAGLQPLRGVPTWDDRFSQYGMKVSFWGSGTLKIVIYVENYPKKRCFRLSDYHPLWGWGGVN